jgi:hypothetical protein
MQEMEEGRVNGRLDLEERMKRKKRIERGCARG